MSYQWAIHQLSLPSGGQQIRYGICKPNPKTARRFLVILNGRSEWIEKYRHLPSELNLDDSWSYLSIDHRGQGASGGQTAHVDSYEQFVSDLEAVIQKVVGNKEYSVIAHSMGGLIALSGCLAGRFSPKALCLSSPLISLPDHPMPKFISRPLSQFFSKIGLANMHTPVGGKGQKRFHGNRLTHSYQGYKEIQGSQYPHTSPTFGWVNASFEATEKLWNESLLTNYEIPTLILAGGEEAVVDPQAFAQWMMKAADHSSAPLKFQRIPGARHELLFEIKRLRQQAIAACRHWLTTYASS